MDAPEAVRECIRRGRRLHRPLRHTRKPLFSQRPSPVRTRCRTGLFYRLQAFSGDIFKKCYNTCDPSGQKTYYQGEEQKERM